MSVPNLFMEAYGMQEKRSEYKFIVKQGTSTDEDFEILLRELNSLAQVAREKWIYFDDVPEFTVSNRLMSVHELAKYMGIGMNKAYKLVALSDFPSIKIGTKIMVDKYKLDDYLDTHKEIAV